jgi:hypothetical protein
MDLTTITAPAFILKPQSQLEAQSEIVCPTPHLLALSQEADPIKRMTRVTQWALTALSKLPQKGFNGVKPYNPILGEKFACRWQHTDNSITSLISEQVSHHPPIASMYVVNEAHRFAYKSTQQLQVHFRGNHIDSKIAGTHVFECKPPNSEAWERYEIHFPLIVAKGIIFGDAMVELGEKLIIRCDATQCFTEATFKKNNELSGRILQNGLIAASYHGKLLETVKFDGDLPLSVKSIDQPPMILNRLSEMEQNESRRVWHKVTYALKTNNLEGASAEKNNIEEHQRSINRTRTGIYTPALFELQEGTENHTPPVWEYVGDYRSPVAM